MSRLRFSTLRHFAQSPAHFRYWQGREMEPSAAMRIGTGTHSLTLGGTPVIHYDGVRRGAAWDNFNAVQVIGSLVLNTPEFTAAQQCAAALRSDPLAYDVLHLSPGTNERLIEWDFNGVPFRSTPDRYYGPNDAATLVELKTTRSTQPARFLRDATSRHYHAQVATYRAALASVGVTVARAVIVAVETVPPYNVTVLELTDRALDVGYRTACGWLEQYKVCAATDEWPGYAQSAVPFDIIEADELDWSGVEGDE